ncbi:MAG: DUF4199 domain-containing protein, partial [Bacteroidota bacterium]
NFYICVLQKLAYMFSKTAHFGIAAGVLNILFFLLQYRQNIHVEANNIYVLIMFFITLGLMILAIVNESKKTEVFSVRTGLKTGIGVILLGGIIFWIYQMIHAHYIETDLIDKLADAMVVDLKLNEDLKPEQVAGKRADFIARFNFNLFASAVVKSLFTGFFVSLITSLVIKSGILKNYNSAA